jgi:purine-binding chemotaxis protein CheW
VLAAADKARSAHPKRETQWARGVINLRGRIVPIYDLAARLDVPSSIGEHTRIVIVETNSQTIGLIVDRVEEVVAVELDQFESVPRPTTA